MDEARKTMMTTWKMGSAWERLDDPKIEDGQTSVEETTTTKAKKRILVLRPVLERVNVKDAHHGIKIFK